MLKRLTGFFLESGIDNDYIIQQKTKAFRYTVFIVLLICISVLIIHTLEGHTAITFQAPLFTIIFFSLLGFQMNRKGYRTISAHVIIIPLMAAMWTMIFMDENQPIVSRMNSVIFIPILLLLVPLLTLQKRLTVMAFYYTVNIVVFIFFVNSLNSEYTLTDYMRFDYISDISVIMTFMALISCHIINIDTGRLREFISSEKKALEQSRKLEIINSALEEANNELLVFQKELQKSGEKYRTIVELTEELVWTSDRMGHCIYINHASERIYGLSPDKLIGRHISTFTTPEFYRKEMAITEEIIRGKKESARYETTHFTGEGSPVHFLVSAVPTKDENGIITGVTGIATDITRQKKAEEKIQTQNEDLMASNEEFEAMNEELIDNQRELMRNERELRIRDEEMRAVLNATIDIVMLLDSTGRVLIFNNASAQQFIELLDSGKDINYFEYLSETGKTRQLEQIKSVLVSKQQCRFEDEDNENIYDTSVYPLVDDSGKVERIAVYSKDITIRKNAELKIREQNDELARAAQKFETMNEQLVMRQIDIINSEMKYRNLYENALVGMSTTRISDGTILKMNEMALKLFGLSSQDEVPCKTSIDEFYADINDRKLLLRELQDKQYVHNFELQLRKKDGRFFWVELTARMLSREGTIDSVINDITKRKEAEENVHKLTFYDPLTDLPNKTLFRDKLKTSIVKSQRKHKDTVFAVMCIGIDRFKNINDMHGTEAGDSLLRSVAKRLLLTFREDDVVSRFGGDKFMTLFSDIASTDDIIDVVRKTQGSFKKPFTIDGKEFHITSSLGVCVYPNDGNSAEQLINNSESAMYTAKEGGRNAYQLFDASLNDGLISRIRMETDLKSAISKEEFEPYFQPKVNYAGEISGMEALIRWHSPTRGSVLPLEFIGLAEKNGMIIEIGNIILRQSCLQARKWLEMGYPPIRVSVNLSPFQFRQHDYISKIRRILNETGLAPEMLELEITESGIMENEEENIIKLHQLHDMGVSISIDDFGTGYSSLSKLKEYPIDTLKIDKSFIDEVPRNEKSVTLARTIIDLAHNLGFKVVAEGIETREQLDFLHNSQCDMYQGYYFSTPLPASDFEKLLETRFGKPEEK